MAKAETDKEAREAAAAFLADIEAVCRKHGLCLAASEYASLQVWPVDSENDLFEVQNAEDCIPRVFVVQK